MSRGTLACLLLGCGGINAQTTDSSTTSPPPHLYLDSRLDLRPAASAGIWKSGIGEGFKPGTSEAGVAVGAGFGMKVSSSHQTHDMALAKIHYGWIFSDVLGEDHFYRGNWEMLGEGFGGAQFHPRTAYVTGASLIFRYDFATGTRWIPFADVGAGVSATDIGRPDLSTIFEFNVQGGAGVNYFWRDNSAITFQYRYFHLSNAGIKSPNAGVNTSMFYLGMSWFF